MKKILCILSIALCGVMFVGCGGIKDAETNFNNHLIEIRNNLFAGQNDEYYATVCTGQREQDYALDGVVNELVPFGIVTFARLDNEMLKQDTYAFTLVVNGENVVGSLEKSPYDNTYSADIEQVIADDAEITLELVVDGVNFSQALTNVSSSFQVSKDNAIDIACEELKDSVKALSKEENNLSEAFIKILKDYSGESNRYYWYVGIISPEGETSGVLIDATTGDVISKKV
ncbi:MAG: PepSY domain-containing protein [Clostridia bacterium]|nr:PepSY domain-containing protein [Clostridia bacterium]